MTTKRERMTRTQCDECYRIFDLTDKTDAAEWAYGHDCEAIECQGHPQTRADLLEIMMSSPELVDAVYERLDDLSSHTVVTQYRIIQETLAVLVERGLISHEAVLETI